MDWASALFGAFLGVAAVISLTALALFPVVKRSYLLWAFAHFLLLSVSLAALTPENFFNAVPDNDLALAFAEAAIALGIGCSGAFLATYVEPNLPLVRTRRYLWWMLPIGIFAAVCTYAGLAVPVFDRAHDLALLIAVCLMLFALQAAIRAGSRAARFQAFAWAPLIIIALVSFSYEFILGTDIPYWPVAMLAGLVLAFIVTAMGVVDGFMRVKDERDRALAGMLEAKLATALDPLTNIANRRGLEQHFSNAKGRRPSGLALVDCDHFKRINDQFGHDVGDKVLCAVARGLDADSLFVARLGGEEFILLLYGENWQEAAEIARRGITQAVRNAVPDLPYPITASAGLAALEDGDTLGSVMKRADRALYAAKESGRNRSLSLTEYRPGARLKSA